MNPLRVKVPTPTSAKDPTAKCDSVYAVAKMKHDLVHLCMKEVDLVLIHHPADDACNQQ